MVESVDDVFVKAISTIKTLSSRQAGGLSRPPPENRAKLYGLYKQATEGDIKSLLPRPVGNTPQDQASRNKWQEGMSKNEAKQRYIQLLIDVHATGTPESRKLLNDLEESWLRVKDKLSSRAPSIYSQYVPPAPSTRKAASVSSRRNYTTMSEFGVSQSQVGGASSRAMAAAATAVDNTGRNLYPEFDDSNAEKVEMRNWKQDVTWALETINEEISAMRQRYLYSPFQNPIVAATAQPVQPLAHPVVVPSHSTTNSGQLLLSTPPSPPSIPPNQHPSIVATIGYAVLKHVIIDVAFALIVVRITQWARKKPLYLMRHPHIGNLLKSIGRFLVYLIMALKIDVKVL